MRGTFHTDRLVIREITEADAQSLFELDADTEVMRYIGPAPGPDVAWYRERIRDVYLAPQARPWHGVRVVLDRATSEFLGWVFVRPANAAMHAREFGWTNPGEVEIGFRFRRAVWGQGIATEASLPLVHIALTDPATTAVVACALASNQASLRVLEKLGMSRIREVTLSGAKEPTVILTRGRLPAS